MAVSPLYIEIALHYAVRSDEFPRLDAPACQDVVEEFVTLGLLHDTKIDAPHACRRYASTDGLRLWIDRLCGVPLPKRGWQ